MKIEIKNLKILKELSEETLCYTATVYIDGKRAFEASNHGHGGPDNFHGDQSLINAAEAYAKTLPPLVSEFGELPQNLEMLLASIIEQAEIERDLKRHLKKIVIIEDGKIYKLKAEPTPDALSAVAKRYPKAQILNGLPIGDAIALWQKIAA